MTVPAHHSPARSGRARRPAARAGRRGRLLAAALASASRRSPATRSPARWPAPPPSGSAGWAGDLVAGLGVARRVDQRGDVAAGGQHEPGVAAEQLGAAVAVAATGRCGRRHRRRRRLSTVTAPRSTGVPEHGGRAGPGQRVVQRPARGSRGAAPRVIRVVSAFQNRMSNAGGLLAQQVVVDPVVPDQVVRPQPGEHLGQRPAVQVAVARPTRRGRRAAARRRTPPAMPARAWSSTVTIRVKRGQPVLLAGRGQVRGDQRGDDAARAGRRARGRVRRR